MADGIRTLAVAVCRHRDHILVERGYDASSGEHYLRGIGGGVEFGERAAEALAREWREELGLELEVGERLGVVESLFTYEGRPGHEIVFVFAARLVDEAVYARDEIESVEPDGLRHQAVWVALDELRRGTIPLYPRGMLDLVGDGSPSPSNEPTGTGRQEP